MSRGRATCSAHYELNQLVRENDQKANRTYVYTYSNGNITSKKEYAYTTGDLGALQDTITWNYVDSTWGDLLTGFDGTSITYDEIGNPITYGNYTIDWNGRRLESINLNDTEVLSYEYNIDGQRVSKTYEGVTTEYFYNGSILAGEKTGNNVIIYMYDNNGDIFGFTYNGTEYYYIKNAQNDVVAIADASGNVVVRYYYNAWGEIIDCVDNTTFELSSINPITYRSYYNDNIAGMDMYYLNSRYYVSDWGRFASADGEISGIGEDILGYNVFAYCQNNPVNMSDEDGWPKWATKVLIGTAVIAAAAVLTIATAGTGTALACFAVGALKGAVTGALIGAATGAVTGAVTHRVTTGSWKGADKAAIEGAADGYMGGAITGFVAGGLTSNVCFVAGTKILTSSGLVAIENISSGDWVWAENPETGEKELKQVVQTFVNETDELVHVYVNGEEIITTPEHPFYVPNKGWTSAIELRAGDVLVLQNGEYVVVEKIQHEILENSVTVYNFEVEDFHTYYVGDSSLLVHNVCKNPGRTGKQARLKELVNDDKLSSALKGEIKRDMNAIARGQRTTIRVPQGYNLSHRIGFSANKGYGYAYSDLNTISAHRLHHKIFGWR